MIYGVYFGKEQDTILQVHLTNDTHSRTNERTKIVEQILGESLLDVKEKIFPNIKERITYEEYCPSISDCPFVSCLNKENIEDVNSLRLPLFLSLYTDENLNVYDRIYLSGNLEKEDGKLKCKEAKCIEDKLKKILEHEQKENTHQNAAFFYVSDEKIKSNNTKIKLIQIAPGTTIDELIIQMKRKGRTNSFTSLEKKIDKYIKDNYKSFSLRIENYITGTRKTHLLTDLRDTCSDLKIPFVYYLQQPFSEQALDAMIQYIDICGRSASESWITACNEEQIEKINNTLIQTYKSLETLNDNEELHVCWNSKNVIKKNINNTIIIYKNNFPFIFIEQIDDQTFDYEMDNYYTFLDKVIEIRNSFIPETQPAKTEILTFQNDPFAKMTKNFRFENIFDTVFDKKIPFRDFFSPDNSDNKIKFSSSKGYLNRKYGELTYKELFQNGNFLETEFIFYETIDYLFKTRNPDCQDIDYFQKKKKADFILQSTDFDIMETITNSSFTKDSLIKYLLYSMKGNSHDLSQNEELYKEDKNKYISVCDDTLKIFSFLSQKEKFEKCIIIPDNSAVEFFADICLAMFLLSTNKFEKIVFKMNDRPKFVSDVTRQDYTMLKEFLKQDRLASYLFDSYEKSGRLQFEYINSYTQIPYVRDFPEAEILDLKSADLLIVKGDLNYRRFLLDAFCPFTTPLKNLLPKQLLDQKIIFLRMIKSSLVAGLTQEQSNWANDEINNPEKTKKDEDGLNSFFSSGNYGMISMYADTSVIMNNNHKNFLRMNSIREQYTGQDYDSLAKNDKYILDATFLNEKEVVKQLIYHGANVNACYVPEGGTCLMNTAYKNMKEIAEMLLKNGADVEAFEQEDGWNALMIAVENAAVDVIKLLISYGANVNAINFEGKSSLFIAIEKNYIEIVKLLIEHGANINITDIHGYSPLDYAITHNQKDIIKILLQHGATSNHLDLSNFT